VSSNSPWVRTSRVRRHARGWGEEMPYGISYIDRSISTDGQITAETLRTEEFPTEPAALARAREVIEDIDYKTVLVSDNSGEHLGVVGIPLKTMLTAGIPRR
jgi:hypothetical protein